MKSFVLPALIDCHVHFREPGLVHKGDMESESRAALAGGVTTVCEMPNTIPPTVTVAALQDKVKRATRIKNVDIRFFFGATEHQHLIALKKIWRWEDAHLRELREKCVGLKLYLDHSTGNQKAGHAVIEEAFKLCGELQIPVVCHCEDAEINKAHPERPPESEEKSVAYAIDLAKANGTKLHIAHLSTKQGVELVRQAKRAGVSVTCEVAPHHLFLSTDDYKKLGALAKMNPPLRTRDHQEALWKGIADGTVDCVATDHAPHTLEEKRSANPSSGVPGVETMLPLLLTAAHEGRLSLGDIRRLCFENPNRIFALGKKSPEEGGETIEVDLDTTWTIEAKNLHYKCGWTPYEGWKVRGKIVGRSAGAQN